MRLLFHCYFLIKAVTPYVCFLSLFLSPSVLSAQTCCSNINRELDASFEGTVNHKLRFPNSILSPNSNADTSLSEYGWLGWVGVADDIYSFYVIDDASRASDGNTFFYMPYFETVENICLTNTDYAFSPLQQTCSVENTQLKVTQGMRYRISFDWLAFDKARPSGTTRTALPKAEFAFYPSYTALYDMPLYHADGSPVAPKQGVNWSTITPASWEKVYGIVTIPYGADTHLRLYYSHQNVDEAGMLIDNIKVEEMGISDGAVSAITCHDNGTATNASDDKRSFKLNPVGSVGQVPNLRYNVTAPAGYSVAPTQGIYGHTTSFLLTKTGGSAIGSGDVTITVKDAVNTHCSQLVVLRDPGCFMCKQQICLPVTVKRM